MMTVRSIAFALALAFATPLGAFAEESAITIPIRQFIDAFNKGDVKSAEAAHVADVVIIDEPAPFIWRGVGAFQAWLADLGRDEAARGRSDGSVVLGPAKRTEIAGDSAYVILPADYVFKEKGVPVHEPSQMTFSLRNTAAGWKITSWTWTGPRAMPRD